LRRIKSVAVSDPPPNLSPPSASSRHHTHGSDDMKFGYKLMIEEHGPPSKPMRTR